MTDKPVTLSECTHNPIPIKGCMAIAETLRNIADDMPEDITDATLIMGGEVYHLGTVDNAISAQEAIWNMTFGIHKLMTAGQGEI